ncbi:MAG TPA: 1,2-phenylacetyl-CoA epoxidase subunit PaaD [Ferruginibacter sp.]|nr:1,2-phenylacetyl-CoA epoxidase subunit PaaD [Ferruginibacter sp.]
MSTTEHTIISTEEEKIWQILETVCDPEVPVLSILDLGIVREVKVKDIGIEIIITPTYSGCPAMDAISMDIRLKMIEHGYKNVTITSILSPAWTTDWMSDEGKRKLMEYGIAPPQYRSVTAGNKEENIECPQCHSHNTKLLSQFGSTACKALYQCNDCKEPFDYFKCH